MDHFGQVLGTFFMAQFHLILWTTTMLLNSSSLNMHFSFPYFAFENVKWKIDGNGSDSSVSFNTKLVQVSKLAVNFLPEIKVIALIFLFIFPTPDDLMMTEFMVQLVWKQLVFTLRVYNLLSFGLICSGSAGLIYFNLSKLQTLDPITIVWVSILTIWLYYASAYIMGFLCIFRVICVYMDLRIRKLAQDSFLISQHSKEINNQDIGHVVYALLREFDFSCRELDRFNKFWRFFMLVFYVPGFVYIFFCLTLLIINGPHMYFMDVVICILIFIGTAGMWTYSVLLAGMVPTRAKRLYVNLNKVCLLPLPSFVVTKLDSFVKRFSGRAIGFDCYQMFYVTHEFLYEVVLFSGTSYVLLIDAIIRSML